MRERLVLPAAFNQVPCSHQLIIEAKKESTNREAALVLGVSVVGLKWESDAEQSAACVLQV